MSRPSNATRAQWPANHRPCVKCKEMKSFEEFHAHASCYMGVNTVCKVCRVSSSRESVKNQSREYKLWHGAKSRAKAKGMDFDIELGDIIIPDVCPVFGTPLVRMDHHAAPSLDRIDSSKGYVKGNVWVISNKANMMKGNATLEELRQFARWALTYDP